MPAPTRKAILNELKLQGIKVNHTASDETLIKILTDQPKGEPNLKGLALDQLEKLKSAIIRAKSETRLRTCVNKLKRLIRATV